VIQLTRIAKQRSGSAVLHFDTGDRLELPKRVLNELDLEEEEFYDLERIEKNFRHEAAQILPERAREYLARYVKTSTEYINHFTRKGYPESLVKGELESLRREGFLNDREVAREHIRRRTNKKHYGRHKILAELREKGIPKNEAQDLLHELYLPSEEKERAREYVEKNEELEKRKLASRLESRGFPSRVIGDVID
jgi:regulatory protein